VLSLAPRVDVHQHLWPPALLDALRARSAPPFLRGWMLHLAGEPPFDVDPAHHDIAARADDPSELVLLSLSSPLGIERLPAAEAEKLLTAWHEGVAALPAPFRAWASVGAVDPDLDGLRRLLDGGFVGLQMPADQFATPAAVDRLAPMLRVAEAAGRPVLVHPGPVAADAAALDAPSWWAAVVDYPAQLSAAWWSWYAAGRHNHPDLRICFVAGAGLAPVQHERFTARGGGPLRLDDCTFVDTSSYGPRGVDALIRVLGIDAIVFGTDRPYVRPAEPSHAARGLPDLFGEAAQRAMHVTNPRRLLEGTLDDLRTPSTSRGSAGPGSTGLEPRGAGSARPPALDGAGAVRAGSAARS
jgi:aminocarboxymuconate-semialdehyde decarboxylase